MDAEVVANDAEFRLKNFPSGVANDGAFLVRLRALEKGDREDKLTLP